MPRPGSSINQELEYYVAALAILRTHAIQIIAVRLSDRFVTDGERIVAAEMIRIQFRDGGGGGVWGKERY